MVTYASTDSDGDSYSDENVHEETDTMLSSYMKAMDRELNASGVMAGYERREDDDTTTNDGVDKQSSTKSIDIDRNLAKNILASYTNESRAGVSGPASTLLCGLRVAKLAERDLDSDDDDD